MTGLIYEPLFDVLETVVQPPQPVVVEPHVELLRRAMKLVERGWTQGRRVRTYSTPRYCVLGAIRYADDQRFSRRDRRRARRAFRKTIGTHFIASWNDEKPRYRSEVVDAFRKTIDRETTR